MSDLTPPVCDYEGSDYQQRFWDASDRAYEDAAEAIALKRLLPSHGERLLEIGAGAGRNTSRYLNFKQVLLLDYSQSQLEQARERLGDTSRFIYVAADAYRMPFMPGVFDSATMIRTLHHMSNPQLALNQVKRVLLKEGIFILEYANKRHLKAILRYWAGRQDWNPFDREPVEFARLNFDFHPKAVRGYLEKAGFSLENQLTVSHFRVGLLKRIFPVKWLAGADSLLQRTGKFVQLSPSVFCRCRQTRGMHDPDDRGGIFACPVCHTLLEGEEQDLTCRVCEVTWPYSGGIYDFRIQKDTEK